MGIIERIPTFLTVGLLVAIFVYLKRHARGARLQLWAVGWTLVFTHFLAQLLEPSNGHPSALLLAINGGCLQASAIAFLVSVSPVVEERAKRILLMLALAVPSVLYVALDRGSAQAQWPYLACLVACFGGGVVFFFRANRRPSRYQVMVALLCLGAGTWAVQSVLRGSFNERTIVLLGIGFVLSGVFCYRSHQRPSPAVITISGGFLCWGAVFPMKMLLDHFAPRIILPVELWNIPEIFVALGMILTIVEEKSASIAALQTKAHRLNQQLERFSAITSRLLSGARVDSLCTEIASTITEVSSFHVAAIQLENPDHSWQVAGSSGLSEERLARLQSQVQQWTTEVIHEVCSRSRRVGQRTLLLSEPYEVNDCASPGWNSRDHWLIPLCSAQGTCLGCITLADPKDVTAVDGYELSRIESLAADMSVALELKSLQMQLVQSEKLAAVGQLVAGVAHELNNPLTAVMGYGELVTDEVSTGRAHDHLIKLVNETRRMKKIVDNLLRFSRQSRVKKPTSRVADVVQEVLALREYHMRTHGVAVETHLEADLCALAIDEDKIRQVLLNLLNNSIDALESSVGPKQINIRACRAGDRTMITIEDTGTGFPDLHRALDPFYTTKPVGKGTGLGLSICYGIVREHGGDVRLENVKPHGARVTIELPVVEAAPHMPSLAVAVGASA